LDAASTVPIPNSETAPVSTTSFIELDTIPSSNATTPSRPRLIGNESNPSSLSVSRMFFEVLRNLCHVMAIDIVRLRESGQLSRLPYITQDEINDKSKANSFIKIIAVTQILWNVVQILLRTGRDLAVTQLEIAVLAFSVSAAIIYFLNWSKPKDVKTPYTLIAFQEEIADQVIQALRDSHWGAEGEYTTRLSLASVVGFARNYPRPRSSYSK
jgi:transposase